MHSIQSGALTIEGWYACCEVQSAPSIGGQYSPGARCTMLMPLDSALTIGGNRRAFQCHSGMQARCRWDRGALSSATKLDLVISRVLIRTRSVVLVATRIQI